MDRKAKPKDDLFENSTMTFGEHLEELRRCLTYAAIWLGLGVVVGMAVANRVVSYVKTPLEAAVHGFHARQGLTKLGFDDPTAEMLAPLRDWIAGNKFVIDEVVIPPPEMQKLLRSAPERIAELSEREAESDAETEAKTADIAEALKQLGQVAELPPQLLLRRNEINVSSFEMAEGFMIWFKASIVVGIVLSSPMVFYHLWSFVAAGLHAHERRYVHVYLPFSVLLFISGVLMAFYVVLQYVINFLLSFNESMDVAFEPRLNYYVSFILVLPLGFGVAFQLPLVMLFLQRIGLVETEAYTGSWRIAVVVIFIISMLATPADPTSMFLLAVPLLFLYVLGIGLCMYLPRGRGLDRAAYDPV